MTAGDRPPVRRWLLFGGIVAVGLNLRGPIVAVAPVLDEVRHDLRITDTAAGLLTSAPVLCFAVVSPLAAGLARRIGTDAAVTVSTVAIALGIVVRPWGGYALILAGTMLLGAAIACNNVLLPAIARRDFAARPGPVLSAITTSMLVSAGIPAVVMVPLAAVLQWRAALAVWAVLAVVALALWWAATGRTAAGATTAGDSAADGSAAGRTVTSGAAWRVPAAWGLGLFFGTQALLFYTTTAWLPTMLRAHGGIDAAAAGTGLSLFQVLGLAGAVTVPMLLGRDHHRYAVVVVLAALWLILFLGLLLAPQAWPLWCCLGGVGQGGGIAMGLSLIAIRSSGGDAARAVSGTVQTVGYCLAAAGPVLIGGLATATTGWTAPLAVLAGCSAVLALLGIRAAASRPIL